MVHGYDSKRNKHNIIQILTCKTVDLCGREELRPWPAMVGLTCWPLDLTDLDFLGMVTI